MTRMRRREEEGQEEEGETAAAMRFRKKILKNVLGKFLA